jgi:hypothetical protein
VEGCTVGRDPVAGAEGPESVSVTRSRGVTGRAVGLIIVTAALGYVLGALIGVIWNGVAASA